MQHAFGPCSNVAPMALRVAAVAVLAAQCLASSAAAQSVRFVDADAPPGGNGLSWATAFQDLKPAVAAANGNPAIVQIWVAEGVYFPGPNAYTLRNNLTIYGGFEGDESTLAERDVLLFPTILTGQGTNRIVNGGSVNNTAVLDGLVFRDGRSPGDGGAVFEGSPTFIDCRFENNVAGDEGGAWYGYNRSPRFIRCAFIGNAADEGGGAIGTYQGSMLVVGCRFVGNTSSEGALWTYEGAITLLNSLVAGNLSAGGPSGIVTYEGTLTIRSSTIADNAGGGVDSFKGNGVSIVNSVVWGNTVSGPADISYSCIDGGAVGVGNISVDPLFSDPGASNWRLAVGSPAIDAGTNFELPADGLDLDRDGDLTEPLPVDADGNPRRRDDRSTPDTGVGAPPIVDMGAFEHFPDCNGNNIEDVVDVASGTSQDLDGNGVPDECEDCDGNGVPDSIDIAGGAADCQGDGVLDACQLGAGPTIIGALDDGTAEDNIGNGGLGNFIWLNDFTVAAGGEVLREVRAAFGEDLPIGSAVVLHVWRDPDNDGVPDDAVLRISVPIKVSAATDQFATYDVPDLVLGPEGTRYFVGLQTTTIEFPSSIDKSSQPKLRSWVAAATQFADADPNHLSQAGIFGLVDSFGQPGNWLIRTIAWRDGDCNGNGVPDACDIDAGLADDCNENSIPDTCELAGNDCNENGLPDDCDIAAGFEFDCQPNGRPDACEIAEALVFDVDGNGVPDACEDCDADGIPDGLEIELGAADCQNDGIPDDCQLGSSSPVEYRLDDGDPEFTIASDAPNMAWLIRFTVEENREWIDGVNILYGALPVGHPVELYVWSDPNGDGDPTDAQVLATTKAFVETPLTQFVVVPVGPVHVGPPGTSFFVGASTTFTPPPIGNQFPATKDSKPPSGTSWLVGSFDPIDPNDLSKNADEFLIIDDLGGPFIGVWCLRARTIDSNDCNGNGVPDDCDIADGTSSDRNRDGTPDECEPCVGDLDGDGAVGPSDLAVVLGAWGTTSSTSDLDGDGLVAAGDVAILLGAWGDC